MFALLTKLSASAVQKALANLAAGRSTRTVQMAHNVLVRNDREEQPLRVTWLPVKATPVPDTLILRGISGSPQRRFAGRFGAGVGAPRGNGRAVRRGVALGSD